MVACTKGKFGRCNLLERILGALCWHHTDQLSTLMAKGWRLQVLTCLADPWIVFWSQITSNLLGVVPEGRPISLCNVAFFGALIPSGIVYGAYLLAADASFDASLVAMDPLAFL
jgi:hypothetical protein